MDYSFIKRLKLLIGQKSIRAFAIECGIPDSTFRGYVDGKRHPTTENIVKISTHCGLPAGWLTTGELRPIERINKKQLRKIFQEDGEVVDIEEDGDSIFPVVKTYDDEDTQLHFFCVHCNCWHHHGRGGRGIPYQEGRGGSAGHRVAHCVAMNSPLRVSGVILDVVGKYAAAKKTRTTGATPMCPACHNYYSAAFGICECGYINKARKSKFKDMANTYLMAAIGVEQPANTENIVKICEAMPPPLEWLKDSGGQTTNNAIDQPAAPQARGPHTDKDFKEMVTQIKLLNKMVAHLETMITDRDKQISRLESELSAHVITKKKQAL